ncbi:MAG: hypothetical protein R3181_09760 [Rubricoccaceae bacterium]|nr:hypothetical protein [Rubricoccaceae bacterium]
MTPPIRNTTFAFLAVALAFAGCDTNEPDPIGPGEEELVTEVTLTLVNTADASDTVTITASDPDGDGAGITFSPSRAALQAGATYDGSIELRDTINDEDITEEVEEEAEEHLFRYTLAPSGSVTVTDEDANGFDVGLQFQVAVDAAAAGDGTLNVVLYHFDEEPKTGNDATSDEIDVDIDFPVMFE